MRRGGQNGWTKGLRRATALFLATVTVWILSLTTDFSGAAETIRTLGESPAFVAAALSAELGQLSPSDEPELLGRWGRLAVGQSPLLAAGERNVAQALASPEPTPEPTAPAEPDDPHDPADLPAVTAAPDDILAQTLKHQDGYLAADDISINNTTSQPVDVAALAAAPVEIVLEGGAPQILIMHTHGTEAYTMDGTDIYTPSDTSRTTDGNFNVLRVGDEIAEVLTEMGFSVLHDRSLYDYPAFSGAYDRSKAGVERYLAEYPSIQIVLDVHRDALVGENGETYKTLATVEGREMAQVMLVVGSNDTGLNHPNWQKNLTLAMKIQGELNAISPTLARPITIRTSRFNQQLTMGSLLVEVGSHGNTLQEALEAARLFARAAGEEFSTLLKDS